MVIKPNISLRLYINLSILKSTHRNTWVVSHCQLVSTYLICFWSHNWYVYFKYIELVKSLCMHNWILLAQITSSPLIPALAQHVNNPIRWQTSNYAPMQFDCLKIIWIDNGTDRWREQINNIIKWAWEEHLTYLTPDYYELGTKLSYTYLLILIAIQIKQRYFAISHSVSNGSYFEWMSYVWRMTLNVEYKYLLIFGNKVLIDVRLWLMTNSLFHHHQNVSFSIGHTPPCHFMGWKIPSECTFSSSDLKFPHRNRVHSIESAQCNALFQCIFIFTSKFGSWFWQVEDSSFTVIQVYRVSFRYWIFIFVTFSCQI